MEAVYGFIGAAAALALFGAGAFLGWGLRDLQEPKPRPPVPPPDEQERRRLREEQEAFRQLQNYSAGAAYGEERM